MDGQLAIKFRLPSSLAILTAHQGLVETPRLPLSTLEAGGVEEAGKWRLVRCAGSMAHALPAQPTALADLLADLSRQLLQFVKHSAAGQAGASHGGGQAEVLGQLCDAHHQQKRSADAAAAGADHGSCGPGAWPQYTSTFVLLACTLDVGLPPELLCVRRLSSALVPPAQA